MKNVLLRLWSIWFYILFGGFFALIFPFHLIFLNIKRQWAHDFCHWLNKVWGYVIMYPAGVWVVTEGRNQLRKDRIYIFAPNHTSYLDIPICNVSMPVTFRFIGKAELNSTPFFGYMFKRLHIPVNRGSVTESFKSFLHAKKKLSEGRSILVFPEGTIPDKTKVTLLRFKDGAFRMAIENKVAIVPVTIIGADRAMPDNGKFLIHPTKVRVIFHAPIETDEMVVQQAAALKEQVYGTIYNTLLENGEGRAHEELEPSNP